MEEAIEKALRMKIYIASSWKNQETVLVLARELESYGFEVDAFCRTTDTRYAFHWSELVDDEDDLKHYDAIEMLADPRTQRAFQEDRKWLDWSACVVMVLPCGRSSHLEAGYAKGKGKALFIYGEFPKGEFDVMYGFADGLFRISQLNELVKALKGKEAAKGLNILEIQREYMPRPEYERKKRELERRLEKEVTDG